MKQLVFLSIYLFTTSFLIAQSWQWRGSNIYPRDYSASNIRIAEDNSIWLLANNNNVYSTASQDVPMLATTTNFGSTWTKTNITLKTGTFVTGVAPINKDTAYLTVFAKSGLLKTTDAGKTLTQIGDYPYYPIAVHFFNERDGIIFADMDDIPGPIPDGHRWFAISVTSDGGINWKHILGENGKWSTPEGTSMPEYVDLDFIGAAVSFRGPYDFKGDLIAIGTGNGSILLSSDKGYNWKRIPTPMKDIFRVVTAVSIKDESTIMIGSDWSFFNNRLDPITYATADGGKNWVKGNPPSPTLFVLQHMEGTDSTFVLNGYDTEITRDLGKTWEELDDISRVCVMDFNDARIGVGTCANTERATLNGQLLTMVVDIPTSLKRRINNNFITIFPNPSTTTFTISLNNDWSGALELQIFDLLGRSIEKWMVTKHTRELETPIVLPNLESGTYLFRVTNGVEYATKTLIVK